MKKQKTDFIVIDEYNTIERIKVDSDGQHVVITTTLKDLKKLIKAIEKGQKQLKSPDLFRHLSPDVTFWIKK